MRLPIPSPPLSPGPALRSYDAIVVAISGGKDSQAALYETLMACGRAAVYRGRVLAVHADLGAVEWPGVVEIAQEHARRAGVEFVRTSRQGRPVERPGQCYQPGETYGTILDHARRMGHWPKRSSRYCTSDHKRDPIIRTIREMARRRGWRRVLNVMGMRSAESKRRSEMSPFVERARRSSSKALQVDEWLPIHGWSEGDVWRRVWSSGWPWHEAYDWGQPRLSCSFCILSSKPALRLAAYLRPEMAERYADVERAIGESLQPNVVVGDLVAEQHGLDPLAYARAFGAERIKTWEG